MSKRDAYLYYEAGQAVAAAHLRLKVRHISANPALEPSDIVIPRDRPKAPIILWLTGMAAEKRGVGKSDPLRRTRNRARVRALMHSITSQMSGPQSKRQVEARILLNQAQDRANAICTNLHEAIQLVVEKLREKERLSGEEVGKIVEKVKAKRSLGDDLEEHADDL